MQMIQHHVAPILVETCTLHHQTIRQFRSEEGISHGVWANWSIAGRDSYSGIPCKRCVTLVRMDVKELIASINEEISRLQQARALLAGNDRGHTAVRSAARRRTLSAEARARIAEAQRKRWAKQKKASAKTAA